jgi:tRNA modification GTPase
VKDDTIAAIATPAGQGGIGIVRVSGELAAKIGSQVFRGRLRNRRAVLGHVWDPVAGEVVDEALGLLMLAPRTYTREDTLELQAHGGPAVLQRILALTLREGARPAEPGEFTLRAFINGRLDLAQAEAVLDVIQAQTDTALRLAVDGLGGRLSGAIRSLRLALIDLLAYLSARADFPDEDVPPGNVQPALAKAIASIDALLASADYGMVYRQGIRVTLAGSPNTGKSSLMNRLLREDRAIVTAVPGTTRDTVSESLNLDGIPIVLTDTAGLATTADTVELLGIERSRHEIAKCDVLLIVLENGRSLGPDEDLLLRETAMKPRIIALNKIDLGRQPLPKLTEAPTIPVSALTGQGINHLEKALAAEITHGRAISGDSPVVTNVRHKAALERARNSLTQARDALAACVPEDLASSDVRAAVFALGEITGETISEDLLDAIFRNFCIGK